MRWKTVSTDYLDYLRKIEGSIPRTDYGNAHWKPFFGELFRVGNLVYLAAVSSPKEKHLKMKNSPTFSKVYHPKGNQLLAVVNLNYMFPAPESIVSNLSYADIDSVRDFSSDQERSKYIRLLKDEISAIDNLNIDQKAKKLYDLKIKFPNSPISKNCLNFEALETAAHKWENRQDEGTAH